MGDLLRIDLTTRVDHGRDGYRGTSSPSYIGGKGIGTCLLSQEVGPGVDP